MIDISVIVPVYNVEKYICRCIESILQQSFVDFEVILVDDGTLDNSGKICDNYAQKDKRISVVHKENGGLSSARNAGLKIAKGKYILFVDSDDIIHPDTLSILHGRLIEDDSEITIGEFCRFDDDLEGGLFESKDNRKYNIYAGVEILEKLYDKEEAARYVSVCGKLFKRSLFEDVRFPVGRLFEDEFTTYLLYYKASKVSVCDKVLYYYFVNNKGITRNLTLQKYFDEYDAQWQRIFFYQEKGLKEVYHKSLLAFLDSAQWDLIKYRNKREIVDQNRGKRFEQQFRKVFKIACKERLLSFEKHYDYYVLGKPEYILFYRIKRLIRNVMHNK